MDLFARAAQQDPRGRPLAERMRPQRPEEMVGQEHLLGPGRALQRLLHKGEIPSMILWGPPGSGKTTLAKMMSDLIDAEFENVSAVMSGVRDLREIVGRAQERRNYHRRRTVVFIDEIHRFNKAQQDALLPHVESGLFVLVGATTENPSFEINAALLSRCRVFVLEPLSEECILELLRKAFVDENRGLGKAPEQADEAALTVIAQSAHGDARRALTTLEVAVELMEAAQAEVLDVATVEEAVQHKALLYDKAGDEHYGVVSALIKSMRGSDPDAAVYWMVRMLESGEDPRFILRRLVIFASEDIGNADPMALQVVVSALQAYELVGLPEGVLPLTQAATYLACAPKSNAVIKAYGAARKDVRQHGPLAVPPKLRNAPTRLMKNLGHGRDYKYPHNFSGHYVAETYLPEKLLGARYYEPTEQGYEKVIRARLRALQTNAESTPDEGVDISEDQDE